LVIHHYIVSDGTVYRGPPSVKGRKRRRQALGAGAPV
jgi:hypothetical protein